MANIGEESLRPLCRLPPSLFAGFPSLGAPRRFRLSVVVVHFPLLLSLLSGSPRLQLLSRGEERGALLERLELDPSAGLCSRSHAVPSWRAACGAAPGWDGPAGTTPGKELGSAPRTRVRGALRRRRGSA